LANKAQELATLVAAEAALTTEISSLLKIAQAENWPISHSAVADLQKAIALTRWNEPHQQILTQRAADSLQETTGKLPNQFSAVVAA
jgi:hypothetical protein